MKMEMKMLRERIFFSTRESKFSTLIISRDLQVEERFMKLLKAMNRWHKQFPLRLVPKATLTITHRAEKDRWTGFFRKEFVLHSTISS